MKKYTAGPWRIVGDADVTDNRGNHIAVLWGSKDEIDFKPPEENKANAHLIAAAPELLEALEAAQEALLITACLAHEYLNQKNKDKLRELNSLILPALKKAKGETNT